jgi:hypothetical protein
MSLKTLFSSCIIEIINLQTRQQQQQQQQQANMEQTMQAVQQQALQNRLLQETVQTELLKAQLQQIQTRSQAQVSVPVSPPGPTTSTLVNRFSTHQTSSTRKIVSDRQIPPPIQLPKEPVQKPALSSPKKNRANLSSKVSFMEEVTTIPRGEEEDLSPDVADEPSSPEFNIAAQPQSLITNGHAENGAVSPDNVSLDFGDEHISVQRMSPPAHAEDRSDFKTPFTSSMDGRDNTVRVGKIQWPPPLRMDAREELVVGKLKINEGHKKPLGTTVKSRPQLHNMLINQINDLKGDKEKKKTPEPKPKV